VEFIESRPLTRKLHHLAGEDADEVLKAIQGELEQKPDRGAMVPGAGFTHASLPVRSCWQNQQVRCPQNEQRASYGDATSVIDHIRLAGIQNVGIITDQRQPTPR
jgi:hypothetical protein